VAEQVCEDLAHQGAGAVEVLELGGAEAEDLVSGELELAVGADAVGVLAGVWAPVGCVVGFAVGFVRVMWDLAPIS
jgi:hypothetical protein